jgi:quinoprotein glucose dehydrogenase
MVIVGSSIDDNRRAEMPSGVVRAYDVHTGALRWKFDPLPAVPGRMGAANAWSTLSVDTERHLVFVPTGSASPDYYGGLRKGDNRYANCVVALHARDGSIAWGFQLVHHDLWDYDVGVQPALLDVTSGGKTIPAVIAANKTGNVFFLDRETGKPIFPVVEKPVPQSDVPGEATSPTQPFPTTPPVSAQSLKPEDAWGLTAADRQWCREQLAPLRNQGIFTPPSLKGSLAFPGNIGGISWGGAAVDPKLGLIYVNSTNLAVDVHLIPRAQVHSLGLDQQRIGYEVSPQDGTPYGMARRTLISPGQTPCNPPPWGMLTALDSSTGKIRWQVPVGRWPIPKPLSPEWGSPTFAGPIVTAGGLVFDVSPTDNHLSAFDASSGKLLWNGELPVPSSAMPMTYELGGKQYLVVAAGGHAKIDFVPRSDAVVAFTLP